MPDLQRPEPRILAQVPLQDAEDMLHKAYFGGKNKDLEPSRFHKEREDFLLLDLPLWMVQPNEDGERYDATVDLERARGYAELVIKTPISARFGTFNLARKKFAYVSDGGHRVSAARMRGDTHIKALMPKSDFERLVAKYVIRVAVSLPAP